MQDNRHPVKKERRHHTLVHMRKGCISASLERFGEEAVVSAGAGKGLGGLPVGQ